MTFMNNHYKEQKNEVIVIKENMTDFKEQTSEIMNKNSEILDRVQTLNVEIKWLNEHHTDLQTRSMRGKLDIFDGIQQQTEEDTEKVLKTFMKRK